MSNVKYDISPDALFLETGFIDGENKILSYNIRPSLFKTLPKEKKVVYYSYHNDIDEPLHILYEKGSAVEFDDFIGIEAFFQILSDFENDTWIVYTE